MKKFILMLITFVAFGASAAPKKKTPAPKKEAPFYRASVYFHYDVKGKHHREALHIEQNKIRVNAEEVQQKNWKKGEASMKALTKLEKSSPASCPKNSYLLKVKKGETRTQTEKGCVGTPRFKQLESAFANLKSLVPKMYDKNMNPL
ncbi:hypothetical protein B9G69_007080 [Bdellovibrio sp. SKB1291214]|uniref:hypothetical protein n=1 Tax=Bdellovibrio sp. SKB1291214 TaxID=1732569 RepID=UPI000B6E19AF|nr:hypothetical protein [Bdellovibrio sp. SKB1291214]UYL10342.1 hypothetical protein B9G69_007080 [Bdellovibrio sp. SKB1291214]